MSITVIVLALFFLTAQLGFVFSIPPGNVTLLWLPSGLAVAAVLLWGPRALLGVYLGSLTANLWQAYTGASTFQSEDILISLSIALGTTAQTYLAYRLLGRGDTLHNLDESIRDIFNFMGRMALACLVAATVGTATLLLTTQIALAESPLVWATWWAGDWFGIIIGAPFFYALGLRARRQPLPDPPIMLIVSFGIGLSLILFILTSTQEAKTYADNFQAEAGEAQSSIQEAVNLAIHDLDSLSSLFGTFDRISREQFHAFTYSYFKDEHAPRALRALSWNPYVTQAERATFESSIQATGIPDFQFTERNAAGEMVRAAERPAYVIVEYIEPLANNRAALGYDVYSNAIRRAAIERARDTGKESITAPITLVQDTAQHPGFLIFAPVYRSGTPTETIEQRRANLRGFVVTVVQADTLFETSIAPLAAGARDIYLFDMDMPPGKQLLYFHPSRARSQPFAIEPTIAPESLERDFYYSDIMNVAGRKWKIVIKPDSTASVAPSNWLPWVLLFSGWGITLLSAGFLINRRHSLLSLQERVKLQERLENTAAIAPGMLFTLRQSVSGTMSIPYASAASHRILGIPAAELIQDANLFLAMIMPEDRPGFDALLETSRRNIQALEVTFRVQLPQKGLSWVETRAMPVREADGSILWHGFIQDVTARKNAETELELSRKRYENIFSFALDAILITDGEQNILLYNAAAEAMFGYPAAEILGKNLSVLFPKALQTGLPVAENSPANNTHPNQAIGRRANGDEFECEVSLSVITTGDDKTYTAIIRDISERAKSEKILADAERQYRNLFEQAPVMNVLTEIRQQTLVIVKCNPLWLTTLGYKENQVLERALSDFYAPAFREPYQRSFAAELSGIPVSEERELLAGDGRIVPVLFRAIAQLDSQGQPTGTQASFIDITERKRAENALRRQIDVEQAIAEIAQRLTNLRFDNQAVLIQQALHDLGKQAAADRCYLFMYAAEQNVFSCLYEWCEKEIETTIAQNQALSPDNFPYSLLPVLHGEAINLPRISDLPAGTADHRELEAQGVRSTLCIPLRSERGILGLLGFDSVRQERVWQDAELNLLQFGAQSFARSLERLSHETEMLALNQTLEQRVQERTAELETSRANLQNFLDTANDLIQSLDEQGRYVYVNQAWCKSMGYTYAEALELTMSQVIDPDYQSHCTETLTTLVLTGESQNMEVVFRTRDGEPVIVEGNVSSILQDGKRVTNGLFRDVTKRRHAEEALRTSLKRVNALYAISQGTIQSIAVQDLVQLVADMLAQTLPADRVYILVMDLKHKRIDTAIRSGPEQDKIIDLTFEEAWDGLSGAALREAKPIWSPRELADLRESTTVQQRRQETEAGDIIVVPLIYQNQALGTITVLNNLNHPRRLDPTDVELVQAIANQASTSIERMRAEITLRHANTEMERALRVKDEFLATMSHELRTPLNAILGLSESLIEQYIGPLSARQVEAMNMIQASGRHLLELINDILDLSKIEAGAMTLNLTRFIPRTTCEAAMLFVKEAASKKRIRTTLTYDTTVEWMSGDERRIKQMLVNLLTNAVKFTPQGGEIGMTVNGDTEQNTVRFTVWDNGIGISEADQTRLFKPFVQLDSSLSRQHEGTGLGLSLVARMAKLHGGRTELASEPGKGSHFSIVLPWAPETRTPPIMPNIADIAAAQIPQSEAGTTKATHTPLILIADDNQANVLTVATYLEAVGYTIATAVNGKEALEMAHSLRPAMILMDLQMPVVNGLEAIRQLRSSNEPTIAQIPIIALTALAMPEDRTKALEAGANAYMTKPVALKALAVGIRELLEAATQKSKSAAPANS